MSKETLISIAQRTRFSVSTVSRVLSGQAAKYRISEKTVALISHEAERCNYTPSLLAKGLRTSRTDTLGLLIPSIDNPYFAHIASIIVHEARTKGYKVILIDTSEDEHNEREGIRSLLSRKVDGILIAPAGDDPSFLETTARQTPVVCIDRHFAKTSLPYVVTDNLRAAARRHSTSSTAVTGGFSAFRACATRSPRPTVCGGTGRRSTKTGWGHSPASWATDSRFATGMNRPCGRCTLDSGRRPSSP